MIDIQQNTRRILAFVALAGLGTCGLAATSVATADGSDITTQRVIYRSIDTETVVAGILADEGVALPDDSRCPVDRLRVSYREPGAGWARGAFIPPLGPSRDDTRRVNGVVRCKGSRYAYVGFQATLIDGKWHVSTVPDPEGGEVGEDGGDHEHNIPDTAPVPTFDDGPIVGRFTGRDIEGYATYEGQRFCDPDAKSGTLGLRNLILAHYPTTTSFGISRPCDAGGRSEHKEGRAFDWGADASDPSDYAAVEDFLRKLLATDEHGNRHALARRIGVMYIIWNNHIWTSSAQQWQPYSGNSPHTDHVHISLSWAGALSQTSFWSGRIARGSYAPALPASALDPSLLPPGSPPAASPSPSPTPTAKPKPTPSVRPTATAKPPRRAAPKRTQPPPSPVPERTAAPTASPSPTLSPAP